MRMLTITATDREWHEAFHDYVARVFPGVSFRRWAAFGGWQEHYRVFALLEENRIVASAALTRMDLVLQGRAVRGWQLGAVGTDPSCRRRGLQRRLLPHVLAQADADDLVFLFANENVLDFYPRFGFRRARESVFTAAHRALPAGAPLRVLAPDNAADRALLARVAAAAEPSTALFGASRYGSIVLWYLCNFHGEHVRYVPEHDALIVAEQAGSTLFVYDVLARTRFDVAQQLPRLIEGPIERIEFFYSPERDWPSTEPTREYIDAPLFVRGPHHLPAQPFKFPALAQT
jgi:ribosomal protein S18 acetylase RimI-like enzyme